MKKYITFIFSALAFFFLGVVISDNNTIQVKEYVLRSGKIKKNKRFVYLTDLHGRDFGNGNEVLLKKIDQVKPDFIVVGGDLITAKFSFTVQPIIELIRVLSRKYKVYYAIGNHEARLKWTPRDYEMHFKELCNALTDAGAVVLDNRSVMIEDANIRFTGLSLEKAYYFKKHRFTLSKHHIDKLVGNMPEEAFNVLLAHNPEYLEVYGQTGADLSLSGHMHGGIMRLPKGYGAMDPRFSIIRPFCWGKQKINNMRAIISPGLSMHTIPVRFFNPGEITVVTLKKRNRLHKFMAKLKKH